MHKEEIKKSVDFLYKQVENYVAEKRSHESKAREAENKINTVYKEISRIRSLCKKHTYIGKKPTCMGRGTCEICGDSDY